MTNPVFKLLGILALSMLAFAQAQADTVVINNGLAPPNPENVVDASDVDVTSVYTRNVGCGDVPNTPQAACSAPGASTQSELAAGGETATFFVLDSSVGVINGGTVNAYAQQSGAGQLIMNGGVVGSSPDCAGCYLAELGRGLVQLRGGVVNGRVITNNLGRVWWTGGSVTQSVEASGFGVIRITGDGFELDGVPIPTSTIMNKNWVTTGSRLTGTLENGEYFDVPLKISGGGRVSLVPEPGTALLLGLGIATLASRRRR